MPVSSMTRACCIARASRRSLPGRDLRIAASTRHRVPGSSCGRRTRCGLTETSRKHCAVRPLSNARPSPRGTGTQVAGAREMSTDASNLAGARMHELRTRILVTFGSKRGGTAEIASRIADVLRAGGATVDCLAASKLRRDHQPPRAPPPCNGQTTAWTSIAANNAQAMRAARRIFAFATAASATGMPPAARRLQSRGACRPPRPRPSRTLRCPCT